jgi:hypothetical protein
MIIKLFYAVLLIKICKNMEGTCESGSLPCFFYIEGVYQSCIKIPACLPQFPPGQPFPVLRHLPKKNAAGTVTKGGNSIKSRRMITSASRNGHTAFTILSILIFPALHATFSTVPTGGVRSPITVFNMNTTPK